MTCRHSPLVAATPLAALLLVACDKLAEITGNKDDKKAATAPAGKADKKGKDAPAIPVVVAPVVEQTVPVKIQAIGNVEVQTSVAIKSRVDGQIMRTAFADERPCPTSVNPATPSSGAAPYSE